MWKTGARLCYIAYNLETTNKRFSWLVWLVWAVSCSRHHFFWMDWIWHMVDECSFCITVFEFVYIHICCSSFRSLLARQAWSWAFFAFRFSEHTLHEPWTFLKILRTGGIVAWALLMPDLGEIPRVRGLESDLLDGMCGKSLWELEVRQRREMGSKGFPFHHAVDANGRH